MDTYQRFLKAVKFERPDHVPVVLLGTPRFFAALAGLRLFDCLHDPCKLIQAEGQAFRQFPEVTFIPGCWPDLGVGIYSAFGCKIYWPENAMPFIKEPVIKSEQDIKSLRMPDFKHDGLMGWYLNTLRMFVERKEEFSNNLHFLHSQGQGEMASYLWDIQEFLANIYLRPELVKELFKKLTEIIIAWLETQLRIMGKADGILFTDDVSALVSPEAYEEFFLPWHRQIRKEFENYIFVFHCDSKSDHILELLPRVGMDVYNFGPDTDLAVVKERIGKEVCLMGNIDPVSIVQQADVEKVKEISEQCLAVAKTGSGYLLSAGGGLNEKTPKENIEAMVEIAKAKGSY